MEKFKEILKKNSAIKIVVLALIFVMGYQFGVSYKKYEDANVGLQEDMGVADRDATFMGNSDGGKILKKITDENSNHYLVLKEDKDNFVGVVKYDVIKETNRFLFFSKTGYRTIFNGENILQKGGVAYGKTEGGAFYYVDFENDSPLEVEIEVFKDFIDDEYIGDIVLEKSKKDMKLTVISKDGSKKTVDIKKEETEFKGKKVGFFFTKLP